MFLWMFGTLLPCLMLCITNAFTISNPLSDSFEYNVTNDPYNYTKCLQCPESSNRNDGGNWSLIEYQGIAALTAIINASDAYLFYWTQMTLSGTELQNNVTADKCTVVIDRASDRFTAKSGLSCIFKARCICRHQVKASTGYIYLSDSVVFITRAQYSYATCIQHCHELQSDSKVGANGWNLMEYQRTELLKDNLPTNNTLNYFWVQMTASSAELQNNVINDKCTVLLDKASDRFATLKDYSCQFYARCICYHRLEEETTTYQPTRTDGQQATSTSLKCSQESDWISLGRKSFCISNERSDFCSGYHICTKFGAIMAEGKYTLRYIQEVTGRLAGKNSPNTTVAWYNYSGERCPGASNLQYVAILYKYHVNQTILQTDTVAQVVCELRKLSSTTLKLTTPTSPHTSPAEATTTTQTSSYTPWTPYAKSTVISTISQLLFTSMKQATDRGPMSSTIKINTGGPISFNAQDKSRWSTDASTSTTYSKTVTIDTLLNISNISTTSGPQTSITNSNGEITTINLSNVRRTTTATTLSTPTTRTSSQQISVSTTTPSLTPASIMPGNVTDLQVAQKPNNRTWMQVGNLEFYVNYNKSNYSTAEFFCREVLKSHVVAFTDIVKYFRLIKQLDLTPDSFWVDDPVISWNSSGVCLRLDANSSQLTTGVCETRYFSICVRPLCASCGNTSKAVFMPPEFERMLKDLRLEAKETQKSQRQLTSAEDKRTTSRATGAVAIAILLAIGILFLLIDFSHCTGPLCCGDDNEEGKRRETKC